MDFLLILCCDHPALFHSVHSECRLLEFIEVWFLFLLLYWWITGLVFYYVTEFLHVLLLAFFRFNISLEWSSSTCLGDLVFCIPLDAIYWYDFPPTFSTFIPVWLRRFSLPRFRSLQGTQQTLQVAVGYPVLGSEQKWVVIHGGQDTGCYNILRWRGWVEAREKHTRRSWDILIDRVVD